MIAEQFSRFGGLVGLIFCVCEGKAMIQAFAIFIGGGIGAVLRYLVGIVMFRVRVFLCPLLLRMCSAVLLSAFCLHIL